MVDPNPPRHSTFRPHTPKPTSTLKQVPYYPSRDGKRSRLPITVHVHLTGVTSITRGSHKRDIDQEQKFYTCQQIPPLPPLPLSQSPRPIHPFAPSYTLLSHVPIPPHYIIHSRPSSHVSLICLIWTLATQPSEQLHRYIFVFFTLSSSRGQHLSQGDYIVLLPCMVYI